jgi:hypothetical protein
MKVIGHLPPDTAAVFHTHSKERGIIPDSELDRIIQATLDYMQCLAGSSTLWALMPNNIFPVKHWRALIMHVKKDGGKIISSNSTQLVIQKPCGGEPEYVTVNIISANPFNVFQELVDVDEDDTAAVEGLSALEIKSSEEEYSEDEATAEPPTPASEADSSFEDGSNWALSQEGCF